MPGLDIGPLHITFYGMILMSGAVLGAWLATHEARRRGVDPEKVWDGLVYVLIGGIIGARLWHVLLPAQTDVAKGLTTAYYLTHPLDAIAIWRGGVGIPGAIIGGGLMLYLFCRRAGLKFSVWVDIAVPALALGQAIGRWGNFVNQELYGLPTDLPWGIYIDLNHRLPAYINVERYHPLFLYESLWNLLNMAFLLWLGRRYSNWLKNGDLLLVYLVTYPIGRFFLDFLRLDVARVGSVNANQTIMLVVAICSAIFIYWRHRPQVETTS